MTEDNGNTAARQRVLDAAEQLFAQKGYTAVTLRDVGNAVGIRHASLYHHVPRGKEQLFVEVTERHLQRHRAGLVAAIEQAQGGSEAKLQAAADWLLSQPPMDLVRMTYSDLPAISSEHAEHLSLLAYAALLSPLQKLLQQAHDRDELTEQPFGVVAGGFLGMIESLYAVPERALQHSGQTRQAMAHTLISILLHGLRPRG